MAMVCIPSFPVYRIRYHRGTPKYIKRPASEVVIHLWDWNENIGRNHSGCESQVDILTVLLLLMDDTCASIHRTF